MPRADSSTPERSGGLGGVGCRQEVPLARYRLLLGLGGLLLGAGGASAQSSGALKIDVPTIRGWSAPIAGEDGRPVALFQGDRASPVLGTSQVEVTGFRMETYRYAPGKVTEIVAQSPSCRFGAHGADSPDRLTLASANGRFAIVGSGWSWTRNSGLLVFSNAVETTVHRRTNDAPSPPMTVRSGRFEYDLRTGAARFLHDTVAEEPLRVRLEAGELTTRLLPSQDEPESIVATNGVQVQLLRSGSRGWVKGPHAIYHAATASSGERIEFFGPSEWSLGPGEGAADHLLLLPQESAYTATGNARMTLELASAGGGSLPKTSVPSGGADSRRRSRIEIASTMMAARSTNLVFSGPIVARQDDEMLIHADRLVATIGLDSPTNAWTIRSARASGDVRVRAGKGQRAMNLTGGELTFDAANAASIALDGDPGWQGIGHRGRAGRLTIDPRNDRFRALKGVRAEWHSLAPRHGTNTSPVRVSALEMEGDGERIRFSSDVDAAGERWRLRSGEAELTLSTQQTVRGFTARSRVVFSYEPPVTRPATNAVAKGLMRRLGDDATRILRQWEIRAEAMQAEIEERSEELVGLDATGPVEVGHPAVFARGHRLTYSRDDRRFRLVGDAELRMIDGTEVIAMPTSALTFDPVEIRLGVSGPVRKMVLPSGLLGGSDSNRVVYSR